MTTSTVWKRNHWMDQSLPWALGGYFHIAGRCYFVIVMIVCKMKRLLTTLPSSFTFPLPSDTGNLHLFGWHYCSFPFSAASPCLCCIFISIHWCGLTLTAERNDAHGVELVLRADVRAHADDEDVAEAGGGRHHPDKDPQHDVGQQVLKGWDAIGVGFAAAHVGGVATVLELFEVAGITGKE